MVDGDLHYLIEQTLTLSIRSIAFAFTLGLFPTVSVPLVARLALAVSLSLLLLPETLFSPDPVLYAALAAPGTSIAVLQPAASELVFGVVLGISVGGAFLFAQLAASWITAQLLGTVGGSSTRALEMLLFLWIAQGMLAQGAMADFIRSFTATYIPTAVLGAPSADALGSWMKSITAVGAFAFSNTTKVLVPFFLITFVLSLALFLIRKVCFVKVGSGAFIAARAVIGVLLIIMLSYSMLIQATESHRFSVAAVAQLKGR